MNRLELCPRLASQTKRRPSRLCAILLPLVIFGISAQHRAHAQTVSILHSFGGGSQDAQNPLNGLVQGTDGNFYGTTFYGGTNGTGTIYKVTPNGVETILHDFSAVSSTVPHGNADGADSFAALVQGSDGNFYGTTRDGGVNGTGTVFKITPDGVLTTLHSFSAVDAHYANSDGAYPVEELVQGIDGDFYGTTENGGSTGNSGTIFKMTPTGTATLLHTFGDGSVAHDGNAPSSLIFGSDGNLYGTTLGGGSSGNGTVYKITLAGVETILHSFADHTIPHDGAGPHAGLVLGSNGDFYGMTEDGGTKSSGTVFQITPAGVETVLHNFADGTVAKDGTQPFAGLVQGTDGDFYGTTAGGGVTGGGTAFKITQAGVETVLHSFSDGSVLNDGFDPFSNLVQGNDGGFYGTTYGGGIFEDGTVFRLDPTGIVSTPVVTSFSPQEGPVGSTVTISGTNLNGVSAVRFHDASAHVFSASADGTHLTVTVPKGALKGTITVTTPGGSAKTIEPFRITYAPVITSFSPASGPVGTVVTITGTHLDGITRVRFHEADATVYSSNAAGTQLTVTVPPGAATGTITLDNRDALATTSTGVFTVTP